MIRKIKLISKFMASQPEKQIIPMHILINISRSKSNKIIKFGQLREWNMRNIFLQKPFVKRGGETIPRLFSKNSKLSFSINSLKFVFIVCQVDGLSKYIETKLQASSFYLV